MSQRVWGGCRPEAGDRREEPPPASRLPSPAFPVLLAAVLFPGVARGQPTPPEPRPILTEAIGHPSWLRVGLGQRSRVEYLGDSLRPGAPSSILALSLRTLPFAEVRAGPLGVALELIDARSYTSEGAPLNNTLVDPLDVLQMHLRGLWKNVLQRGDQTLVQAGRFTLDVGNRRLIARNDFRNTINSFTGLHLLWTAPKQRHRVRGLLVLPVVRRPDEESALRGNKLQRDRENPGAIFWGLIYEHTGSSRRDRAELFLLGLREEDTPEVPSADRRLLTPGARLLRSGRAGEADFEGEVALQGGTSRASSAAKDARDLRHRAFFVHVTVGQSLPPGWPVRVSLHYDHASGDADPTDGKNGRFDTLFGARRFELGPTGFYGFLARSNLRSPGVRLDAWYHQRLDAFVAARLAWLDSPRDGWPGMGLRDSAGASGTFLGRQVEGRLRWHPVPAVLTLDVGAAYFQPGTFSRGAPQGKGEPTLFLYASTLVTL